MRTLDLERTIASVLATASIRGAAVAADGPRGRWLHTYGSRDGHGARVDADTVFAIGSLTKSFTAALILRDIERGTLRANDLASAYVSNLGPAARASTIDELLAQTSGIPTYDANGDPQTILANATPEFAAGSQFAYSNTNYYLLGLVLERAGARPFAQLVHDALTEPLALHDTVAWPVAERNVATGFGDTNAAPQADWRIAFSAAGLGSSANDLQIWARALRDGRVVSSEHVGAMLHARVGSVDAGSIGYGYGFFITSWDGVDVAYESGFVPGFSAMLAIAPQRNADLVILTNQNSVDLVPLARDVLRYELSD